MRLDPFITLTAQYFVALLMVASGVHKCSDGERFVAAVAGHRIVPEYFARPVALLLIGIEVGIGMALMVSMSDVKELAALAATGLLALYWAVLSANLLRGHQVDCGCSFARRATPVSGTHLIRNAVLVVLAIVASMPDPGRALGALDRVQIIPAVISLALIYLSAEALFAHSRVVPGREA